MEILNKLLIKIINLFHFIIYLFLLILINSEERRLTDNDNIYEITLKMKGPIKNYGFFGQNSDGYCFKGEYPSKIILNDKEYINNTTNLTELEIDVNIINLKWNNSISSFSKMFFGCEDILEVDLTHINLSYAPNFEYMFANCISLISVKLFDLNLKKDNFNISLDYMFFNCISLTFIDLSFIQIEKVHGNLYMRYMFDGCINLSLVNIYTIQVYDGNLDMNYMFNSCKYLESVNIYNITVSRDSYINMNYIFNNCTYLESVNISNIMVSWEISYINMNYMFNNCTYLESVNISNIEVIWESSYINMDYMFNSCIYLESINISNIRVSRESYINMNYMFNSCIYLVSINLSNIEAYWDSYINMNQTFSVCKNLRYLHFSFNQEYNVDNIFIFNDVPENIVYCFNKEQNLNNLLSKKKCSLFDCTDNWIENQKKIIFKNNTCIDDCASHSLVDYKNFCYDFCPNRTHKDGFICKDCYPSCEICEQPGTDEIHNCISCKKGYNLIYHKENNTVNCYKYRYNRSEIYNIYVTKIPVAYNFISHLLFCLDNCTNAFINKPKNECNKKCNNNKYFCAINCPNELLLKVSTLKNVNIFVLLTIVIILYIYLIMKIYIRKKKR